MIGCVLTYRKFPRYSSSPNKINSVPRYVCINTPFIFCCETHFIPFVVKPYYLCSVEGVFCVLNKLTAWKVLFVVHVH